MTLTPQTGHTGVQQVFPFILDVSIGYLFIKLFNCVFIWYTLD